METVEETQKEETHKLSGFIKISIVILALITIASISLLFIGDFEGKFERVFSTLTLFVVFVLLTAFDTRRGARNEWYAPVALIANSYILGLLLIVIWVTPYDPVTLAFTILWKSAFVIATTRLLTFGLELLLKVGTGRPAALGTWGQVTSILGVLSLILFTAPVGIETFKITIPEIYWKIAVAALILTGLGLTITLLLRWYYVGQEDAKRYAAPYQTAPFMQVPQQHAQPQQYVAQPIESNAAPIVIADPAPEVINDVANAEVPVAPVEQAAPVVQAATASQELLPWPTFADGTPLPQLPNGQPDFSQLKSS